MSENLSDDTLLKLAAVAGGYSHLPFVDGENGGHGTDGDLLNPLTNMSDALLLLADTKLNLIRGLDGDGVEYVFCHNLWCPVDTEGVKVRSTNGIYAAVRRAIVLAAAKIAIRRFDL